MNEASRGAWGWAAALALLVSTGFSWRLLHLHPAPGLGREVQEGTGSSLRDRTEAGVRVRLPERPGRCRLAPGGTGGREPEDYHRGV